MSNVGEIRIILKEYLDKHNITRYELARKADIRYDTIDSYYKNKPHKYDGYLLAKICHILNCKVEDIIEYKK